MVKRGTDGVFLNNESEDNIFVNNINIIIISYSIL